jgi:hypothetical protein
VTMTSNSPDPVALPPPPRQRTRSSMSKAPPQHHTEVRPTVPRESTTPTEVRASFYSRRVVSAEVLRSSGLGKRVCATRAVFSPLIRERIHQVDRAGCASCADVVAGASRRRFSDWADSWDPRVSDDFGRRGMRA